MPPDGAKMRITALEILDIRFPTSVTRAGSDSMVADPDYSAAYVILKTDARALEGHGLAFTIGRGNELCAAAIDAIGRPVVGLRLEQIVGDMRAFWRSLVADPQLRWLGPEKGVVHLAAAAVVNAVWDLWAKSVEKPLWQLLADLPPEELVGCLDFTYVRDVLGPDDALALLRACQPDRDERERYARQFGYPAYTTSAGWFGYGESLLAAGLERARADGFDHVKIKVGRDLDQAARRLAIAREAVGDDVLVSVDANQCWDVDEALEAVEVLRPYSPWWLEEPTSPDDVLGHAKIRAAASPIRIATGEHVQNRVMFKQFLQARALDVCQIDVCRLAGVNEAVLVLLLAARFGIPVCPHAGGVGLCEYVQHLAFFDYLSVSGELDERWVEYVEHLHEHFVDPVEVREGRYRLPLEPGFSIEIHPESRERYRFGAKSIKPV